MSKKNLRKLNRSGSQCCPICNNRVKLVCHHIHGREVPRWDEKWNCVWLCPNCHDSVHDMSIILHGWYNIDGKRTILFRYKNEDKINDFPDIIPPLY